MRTLITKHPLAVFHALTFSISWGALLVLVGGPAGLPGTPDQVAALMPRAIIALLAGPVIAGLVSIGFGSGFHELSTRLLKWNVGARWYAALLLAPVSMTLIPLGLGLLYPEFLPRLITDEGRFSIVLLGLFAGVMAGVFEELAWTGFVIPKVRRRAGVFTTGLFVGVVWGAFHFIVNLWTSGTASGALSTPLFLHALFFSLAVLPAYRVLMVWVYDRTGSLLLAMLMHASLTFSNVVLAPARPGLSQVLWSLAVAATLWIAVAAFVLRRPRDRGVLNVSPAQFSR